MLQPGVLRVTEMATRPAADERSWREIEQRLRPFVARRVASPADVDDVLQEVFLRLSHGLPALRDGERLTSWLFAIARNAVVDHHRDRGRHPLAEPVEMPSAEIDDSTPLQDDLTACVARFVTLLPDEYREAITLVELEGVSQKEAAAMLGLSHSGMKSRVQRGRAALRRMFEQACALEIDARQKVIACEARACGGCESKSDPSA
jgi:RNA polymerase sigma-70 factor (ECF subfamily)